MSDAGLQDYYARRADEYERIYRKPERQEDLGLLRDELAMVLEGRDVLEIACGTGYWTARVARAARSVLATDISEAVLALARVRPLPPGKVRFRRADAYALEGLAGPFNAALAAFWWSHVPRDRLRSFLENLHARLQPGALAVFVDNRYVEGSSTPLSRRRDQAGNTYQLRRLADGSTHEVMKNFPDEAELRAAVAGLGEEVRYHALTYYWCLRYRTSRRHAGLDHGPAVRRERDHELRE